MTLRQLAADIGVSTMAVYTRFGGMDGLWQAVREEGFARLDAHLRAVQRSGDPVRDLMAVGSAYVANALANPYLYDRMFEACRERPPDNAAGSFEVLVAATRRARDEGRFGPEVDPESAAVQLWAMTHGLVMLVLADALTAEDMAAHLPAMSAAAFVGFGDQSGRAQASAAAGWTAPPARSGGRARR